MIVLMGYLHLNPTDVDTFVADIRSFSVSTRAEKGCLFYAVALDDANTGRMLVVERWQDQASLTNHLRRQETVTFLKKWENKIRGDIQKFDASHERLLMD